MSFFNFKKSNFTTGDSIKYIIVNEFNIVNGKLYLGLNRAIDSIGFFDSQKNYHLVQGFEKSSKVVLNQEDFIEALPKQNYYGRRIIKAQIGNDFFEIINADVLKQHVSERYFKLEEHAGWVSVYYFSTDGKFKAGVLYSQNFHRSIKKTGVIRTKLVNSELFNDVVKLEIQFYNRKRINDLIKNKKIKKVLIHDDAIQKGTSVNFSTKKANLEIELPIKQLLNNGWLTIETFDGIVYDSISIEIDKVYSNDDFVIDKSGEVSHIRVGKNLKSRLFSRVPENSDKFNMSLDTYAWKLRNPEFSIRESKKFEGTPLISIIIPNWNNGPYLRRAMDSIVKQTISLNKIEVIFVDDRSSDNSLEIMDEYRNKYPNFKIVSLNENTGGASIPRNVGLTLAKGKYIVLLDPDDWFTVHGLKDLVEVLEKSGDAFAIGGMVEKVGKKFRKVFNGTSFRNAINVDIGTLPVPFYSWMGPQSIMIRHDLIKEKNLHFPIMRTSDDQKFFFEAMYFSKTISQTRKTINFLNHDEDNVSLMTLAGKSMEIFDNAIRLWEYLIDNNYKSKSAELLISRKLEIQFERYFYNSKMKEALSNSEFMEVIRKFTRVMDHIGFDPSIYFEVNDHKVAWKILIIDSDLKKGMAFIEWTKLPKTLVPVVEKNGIQYRNPIEFNIPLVPYNFVVQAESIMSTKEEVILTVKILSNNKKINGLIIRDRANEPEEFMVKPEKVGVTSYTFSISREFIRKLKSADYDLLVLWDDVYYANVQYGKLSEYDYDSLRHDGFFKQGNRLGFRNHPILYADSIKQIDNKVELNIDIEGYYEEIKGIEFRHRKFGNKYLVMGQLLENRVYNFSIELPNLKQSVPGGELGINIIFDNDKTIRVPMYAMNLNNVPNSGFIETQFHNLAFEN